MGARLNRAYGATSGRTFDAGLRDPVTCAVGAPPVETLASGSALARRAGVDRAVLHPLIACPRTPPLEFVGSGLGADTGIGGAALAVSGADR